MRLFCVYKTGYINLCCVVNDDVRFVEQLGASGLLHVCVHLRKSVVGHSIRVADRQKISGRLCCSCVCLNPYLIRY